MWPDEITVYNYFVLYCIYIYILSHFVLYLTIMTQLVELLDSMFSIYKKKNKQQQKSLKYLLLLCLWLICSSIRSSARQTWEPWLLDKWHVLINLFPVLSVSRVELKRLCEIFTRMFADPHSKVRVRFCNTHKVPTGITQVLSESFWKNPT